jgi:hypothetical protein
MVAADDPSDRTHGRAWKQTAHDDHFDDVDHRADVVICVGQRDFKEQHATTGGQARRRWPGEAGRRPT